MNVKMFFGLVAEDRPLTSRLIKVFVKEMSPHATGALSDNTSSESFSLKGSDGKAISGNVKTTSCVTAEYLDLIPNRSFPPDVVKGEQVILFQYANSDIYYWISAGRDDKLRRGEILRFGASDDMAVVKDLTDANTYFIELDTKVSKRIRLSTCKSNGEAFKYELIFDAKNNKLILGDDKNNQVEMYSDTPRVVMHNTSGTTVDLNDKNLLLVAMQDMLIRADGSMLVKTPNLEVVADSIVITAGNISYGGEGGSGGAVAVKGNVAMDGNVAISQDTQISGNVTVAGTVTASSFIS